jgi:hypothetical protein
VEKVDFLIESLGKVLVASAEQSFLYQYLKGFLPPGRFQAITPCFRDERFDVLHGRYFMKNELIITDSVAEEDLLGMIDVARRFFKKESGYAVDVSKISENTYDMSINGVEVGSYGIRRCEYLEWIYGTGCAEPRFSQVLFQGNGLPH